MDGFSCILMKITIIGGDKMGQAINTSFVGMTVVFIILALMAFLISLLSFLIKEIPRRWGNKKST